MKVVIAARHGQNDNGPLSRLGKEQSQELAAAILGKVGGGNSIAVLHSKTRRATETAEIIGHTLDVTPRVCETLGYDSYHHGDDMRRAVLALAAEFEILIAVTHYEAPAGIIDAFANKRLGRAVASKLVDKNQPVIPNGTALCLDLGSGELSRLP